MFDCIVIVPTHDVLTANNELVVLLPVVGYVALSEGNGARGHLAFGLADGGLIAVDGDEIHDLMHAAMRFGDELFLETCQ